MSNSFKTVDMHVSGEPLRIITEGIPDIKGDTQLERRLYCMEHLDDMREVLMYEPRGHHGMYGCIITEPASANADFGVLFMHNEGWSTMCGHGIIAVMTMGIETGRLKQKADGASFIIDTPAGQVVASAIVEDGKVKSVAFQNVASFVYEKDLALQIDNKEIQVDIAFGGAFYGVVHASKLNLQVNKKDLPKIKAWGSKIKHAIEQQLDVVHPNEKGLHGIYGVIFLDDPVDEKADLRNVTIFADEQVDRSPCGTGTSAIVALLQHDGKLQLNEDFYHECITDGVFIGKAIEETAVGTFQAVLPTITGDAYITGIHQFFVDPHDPLPKGFLLEE